MNKASVSLAAKAMCKLGGGIGLLLQTVKGIAQGKHKKRRIFKKEEWKLINNLLLNSTSLNLH